MKRCPVCNQTFSEEWLSFCTHDGASLVDTSALPQEPPPTMVGPPMPPSVSPTEQPTLNLPGAYRPPPPAPVTQPAYSPPQPFSQPQPMQSWQPPPPPTYATAPQQSLAVASLICGIVSITIGWCCSLGLLTGPVAIGLGIGALVQIKNNPTKYTGKPLAITGIALGGAYLVFWVFIILIWGMGVLMQGLK